MSREVGDWVAEKLSREVIQVIIVQVIHAVLLLTGVLNLLCPVIPPLPCLSLRSPCERPCERNNIENPSDKEEGRNGLVSVHPEDPELNGGTPFHVARISEHKVPLNEKNTSFHRFCDRS